jgi:hypothetical protein
MRRRTAALLLALGSGCRTAGEPGPPAWAANVAPAEVISVDERDGRRLLRVREDTWDFVASVPPSVAAQPGDHVWLGKGPAAEVDGQDVIVIEEASVATAAQIAAFEVLAPPPGGLSVAGVHALREAGRTVAVRGRVVKASYDVFGTNWYHLRDGTGSAEAGDHDLTVTSAERFEVGRVLVAEGPLTVDKDLGFGYFYAVILEDARVSAELR